MEPVQWVRPRFSSGRQRRDHITGRHRGDGGIACKVAGVQREDVSNTRNEHHGHEPGVVHRNALNVESTQKLPPLAIADWRFGQDGARPFDELHTSFRRRHALPVAPTSTRGTGRDIPELRDILRTRGQGVAA